MSDKVFVFNTRRRVESSEIFRIPDDMEIDEDVLTAFITRNKTITNRRYRKLWEAYNNDYPIYRQPRKQNWKPDHRVSVNFAQYITDTFEGFFLGNPVKTTSSEDEVSDYVSMVDAFNDQDDNNSELSRIVSIFGRGYEMYYTDEDAMERITYLNPMDAFMIYDEGIVPKPRAFVRIYTDCTGTLRGSVSDETTVRYFIASPFSWVGEPDDHNFDGVPATEYIQNDARMSIFESVLNLINEYNKVLSEKSNDVDYFADAYLKILGAQVDESTLQFMRDSRVVNFGGRTANNVIVDFLQKPNGDTTQEHLLDRLERMIFTISMVVNINDDNFGVSSGIALKYKLLPLLNLMKTKERKFTSGMNRRYKILFSNPVSGMKPDAWTTLDFTFTPNIPVDYATEANTASALAGITSKKTQLNTLSIIKDVDRELEQIAKEQDELGYDTDYPTSRVVENTVTNPVQDTNNESTNDQTVVEKVTQTTDTTSEQDNTMTTTKTKKKRTK